MSFKAKNIQEVIDALRDFEATRGIDKGGLSQYPDALADFLNAYGRAQYLIRGIDPNCVAIWSYLNGIRGTYHNPHLYLRIVIPPGTRQLQALSIAQNQHTGQNCIWGNVCIEDRGLSKAERQKIGIATNYWFYRVWPSAGSVNIELPPELGVPTIWPKDSQSLPSII